MAGMGGIRSVEMHLYTSYPQHVLCLCLPLPLCTFCPSVFWRLSPSPLRDERTREAIASSEFCIFHPSSVPFITHSPAVFWRLSPSPLPPCHVSVVLFSSESAAVACWRHGTREARPRHLQFAFHRRKWFCPRPSLRLCPHCLVRRVCAFVVSCVCVSHPDIGITSLVGSRPCVGFASFYSRENGPYGRVTQPSHVTTQRDPGI